MYSVTVAMMVLQRFFQKRATKRFCYIAIVTMAMGFLKRDSHFYQYSMALPFQVPRSHVHAPDPRHLRHIHLCLQAAACPELHPRLKGRGAHVFACWLLYPRVPVLLLMHKAIRRRSMFPPLLLMFQWSSMATAE